MRTESRFEKKAQNNVILPTTKMNDRFEVSMFRTPPLLRRELEHVFSAVTSKDAVTAVLTCQHTATDLVKYGDDADEEKDMRLEDFVAFAKEYCDALIKKGHWADFIE